MFQELYVPSAEPNQQLYVKIWKPATPPWAVVQIVHGMREHLGRYETMARFFVTAGLAVVAHEHLGHGRTAADAADLGFFAEQDAADKLVSDVWRMTQLAQEQFADCPIAIVGHSMGSIVVRRYLMAHSEAVAAAFLMGTSHTTYWENMWTSSVLALLNAVHGGQHRLRWLSRFSDKRHNEPFAKDGVSNSWLTRDAQLAASFHRDPLSKYPFSLNGYLTIARLQKYIEQPRNMLKTRRDLPMRFLSGTADTLSNNGEGIKKLVAKYRQLGFSNVAYRLYEGARHELHNEWQKEAVFSDMVTMLRLIVAEQIVEVGA